MTEASRYNPIAERTVRHFIALAGQEMIGSLGTEQAVAESGSPSLVGGSGLFSWA